LEEEGLGEFPSELSGENTSKQEKFKACFIKMLKRFNLICGENNLPNRK